MEITSLQDSIRPVSDFRKSLPKLLKRLQEDHHPIILTQRGRSVAVVVDVSTYERLNYEGQLRASYERGLKDIEEGRTIPHAQMMKEMRQWVRPRSKR